MKELKNISFGLGIAVLLFIGVQLLGNLLLNQLAIGNYADFIYVMLGVIIAGYLLWQKNWVLFGGFVVGAALLFPPVLLVVLSTLGCLVGQCLNF